MFDLECTPVVSPEYPDSKIYPCFDVAKIATRRRLGAYYTPHSAADYMAAWIVRANGDHILEPSFGDGIFLRAVTREAQGKKLDLGVHFRYRNQSAGATGKFLTKVSVSRQRALMYAVKIF